MILEPAARWGASLATSGPILAGVTARALFDRPGAGRSMRDWCRLQHRIFGLDVTVDDRSIGRYDQPPYLFVHLNQASLIETFLFPALVPIPFRLIVNIEYALIPAIGPATVALGAQVIVRQWGAQARRGVDRAIADLKNGDSYGMSIEGRRSEDGRLQPYKRGAAVIAIRSGATIVPFITHGARERMPYGDWRVNPGRVHGVVLEHVPTTGLTLADRHTLTDQLRTIAEQELDCRKTPLESPRQTGK